MADLQGCEDAAFHGGVLGDPVEPPVQGGQRVVVGEQRVGGLDQCVDVGAVDLREQVGAGREVPVEVAWPTPARWAMALSLTSGSAVISARATAEDAGPVLRGIGSERGSGHRYVLAHRWHTDTCPVSVGGEADTCPVLLGRSAHD